MKYPVTTFLMKTMTQSVSGAVAPARVASLDCSAQQGGAEDAEQGSGGLAATPPS